MKEIDSTEYWTVLKEVADRRRGELRAELKAMAEGKAVDNELILDAAGIFRAWQHSVTQEAIEIYEARG